MNLPYTLLPLWLHGLASLLFALIFLQAIRRADWRRFKDKEQLHLLLGSCVLLLLIWSLKAGIKPGLDFHLLGATLFMLMYGWEVAFVALGVVLTASVIGGFVPWQSLAVNALLMGALPVLFTHWVYRLALWFLPHNFFIYVLVNGFLCAGLGLALMTIAASALLLSFGVYGLHIITQSYLLYIPFMMFGEGFLTGMVIASMVLMKPHWLLTFDDRLYIAGK